MKHEPTPARIVRTRWVPGLLLAAVIAGPGLGAKQGFGAQPTVTLEFSTFVGSTGCSYATLREATVDSAGNILAVGRGVYKPNGFGTTTVHKYGPLGGTSDIIVGKLKHDGTKLLADTTSRDDPNKSKRSTGRFDHAIVKVSPDGKRVEYCRFLGVLGMHLGRIALDARGRIYANDWVNNPRMHVSGNAAFPKFRGGKHDGAFHIFSNDMQTCLYSTFLGGSGNEIAEHRIAVDRNGTSSLVGWTNSTDFPTTRRAHQRKAGGGTGDGYLAKFTPDGRPVFITYIGGSGAELPNGQAMDGAGRVFVTGFTTSADFEVTPNAHDSTYGGGRDMFLRIYSPTGQLLYSTFAGGKADDGGRFVTVDAKGNPVIVGRTLSREFPTTPGAHDRNFAGKEDLFCMKFRVSRAPARPPATAKRPATP